MFAINFYSELYEDQLRRGRKTATVRLGDKSAKYQAGQLVWITVGQRFGRRQKLFTAIIDRVDVKLAADLSPRDIQRENPEMRALDEILQFLTRIYGKPVTPDDTISVVYFSAVSE
ncbi:MAG: ASCH domain-containing protein [Armatimonadetes bacterium]|nr:ASCH domain-containing protein [Armatimonadota bacterium]